MTHPVIPLNLCKEEFAIAELAASAARAVVIDASVDGSGLAPEAAAKAVVDAFLAAKAQLIAARS